MIGKLTSRVIKFLTSHLNIFRGADRGNIAIVFGISLPVILISVGLVIDYSRASRVDKRITDAADAALLAVTGRLAKGEQLTDSEINEFAKNVFNANTAALGEFYLSSFAVTRDANARAVSIDITGTMPATFLSFAGLEVLKVGTLASATYGVQNIELALMLDVTGSMGSAAKIGALKLAAADLVDMLISGSGGTNTRISLVPYSSAVNAGAYARTVTNNHSSRCVIERGGAERYSDKSGADYSVGYYNDAKCPTTEIVPLTSDAGKLKGEIARLRVGGSTAGHIGVAWSYYTLSPGWADVFGKSAAQSYATKDLSKVAVLMTDGEFNQFYTKKRSKARWSRRTAKSICAEMRTDGIRIYTVAFALNSHLAEDMLRKCASTGTNGNLLFYEAQNGTELRRVFQAIAADVSDLRLSR